MSDVQDPTPENTSDKSSEESVVHKGGCLCGAVRFIAEGVPPRVGVCHCPMCQKWTGSGLAEVSVPEDKVHWRGLSQIRVYQSSDWGERAFCGKCGAGLWFRVTEEGDYSGNYDIPLGLFDNPDGFELAYEIYTDHRPPALRYEAKGQVMLTRAECVVNFPRLAEDGAEAGPDQAQETVQDATPDSLPERGPANGVDGGGHQA